MFGNLGKMLKAAGEIKRRMPEMQQRLASSQFQAEAGGGAVRAAVSGKMALVDLRLAPELLAEGDPERLAELIKEAVAAAQEKAAAAAAEMMKELTGGMELPGLDGMLS